MVPAFFIGRGERAGYNERFAPATQFPARFV